MFDFNDKLTRQICNTLLRLGIPPHILGYGYLVCAIRMVANDPSYLREITKRLYPDVAAENGTTPQRVERAIRNAVEIGFSRCKIDDLNRFFGTTVMQSKGKLTNSEFIAIVAQRITFDISPLMETQYKEG